MLRVRTSNCGDQPRGELLHLLDERARPGGWRTRRRHAGRSRRSPRSSCRARAPGRGDPRARRPPRCCGSPPCSSPARSCPSSDDRPPSSGRNPMIESASSLCPLPSTPATPTISPARTSSESPWSRPPRRSSSRSTVSPTSTCGFSRRKSTGRPTIISASLALFVSAGVVSPTTAPRRSTVMRSAIASTSSSLWLMKTIVLPSSRSSAGSRTAPGLRRCQHRRRLIEDQDVDPAVEGLEDLHALLLTDGEILDGGRGVDLEAVGVGQLVTCCSARLGMQDRAALVAEDDVLGDREGVHQHEVLVDHADAERDRVARRRDLHLLALSRGSCRRPAGRARRGPASGWTCPRRSHR